MILVDKDIKKRLKEKTLEISPCKSSDIQPASVDLHLRHDLKTLKNKSFNLQDSDYILKPNEFILGSTNEYVSIPNDLVALVDGKSSLGRLGIAIHITAGFIDPGFKGNITLEIKNNTDSDFVLKNGMSIGQIVFFVTSNPCELPYGDAKRNNHYQDSIGCVLSRYEY